MSRRKGKNKILAILITIVMVVGMIPMSALAAPGDEYTVTFIDWDNTVLGKQTVIEGSAAIAPTVPPRTGYDFDDWDVDFSVVHDDLIVRATYTPIVYTITYDLGGGTNDPSNLDTYTVEDTPLWFYPPARTGYAFVGWTTGFNIPGGTTGDIELTAVWIQNQNGRVEASDGQNTVILGRTTNGNGQGQYFIIVLNQDGQIIDATTNLDGPSGTEEFTFEGGGYTLDVSIKGNNLMDADVTITYFPVRYEPGTWGSFTPETHTGLVIGDQTPDPPLNFDVPSVPGWTFAGWNPTWNPVVTGSVTYVAQWNANDYTIIYDPGTHGTWLAGDETYTANHGDTTPAFSGDTSVDHDPGWTFAGWTPSVATTVTETVTYVAQWTQDGYTIVYDPGAHGSWQAINETYTANYGDPTPAFGGDTGTDHAPGWTFAGWTPSVAAMVTGSVTYVAQWTQNDYTIVYDPGLHGTWLAVNETYTANYGDQTPAFGGNTSTDHTPGWTFAGWTPQVSGTVTGNATYVAQWTQDKYTVTYTPGTQGTFTAQVTPNLNYGAPTPAFVGTATGNPGYTFIGWDVNPIPSTVTETVTYTAQWSRDQYTVTYAPGTQGTFTAEVTSNLVYGAATPTFVGPATGNPGWTFAGWTPQVSGTVTGNATYVAQWTQNNYTIVYDPGAHGSWLAANETYTANHGDTTPAFGGSTSTDHDPGWTFLGWTPQFAATVTGSVTYVAQWTQNDYTIVYDPGAHGTWLAINETHTANYGDQTPAFSGSTSTDHDPGWTFTGWLPSVANTVTGNVTYVAQWSETIVYNITYILNGGTNDPGNPNKYTEEDDDIVLKDPTRAGYNFIEWMPADNIPAGSTGDKEFTAIWSDAIIYTITYVLNGGANHDDNPATYTVESSTIVLGAPSREGSTFNRWAPTDSIPAGSTGNKTFTASWTTTGGGGGGGGGGPTVITDNPPPQAETVEEEETIEEEEVPLAELDIENHFAYIIGYEDDTVRPQNYITRAEVSTIFFRLLTLESREEIWSKTNDFPDVDANSWYNNAISTLTNGGILQGYPDGTFRPKATITRAELATIAVRFQYNGDISSFPAGLDSFTDISGHWAENYIKLASELGYVSGYPDGSFRPNAPISRAEVATLLNNVLNRHVESKEDMKDGMKTWVDNPESAWYYFAIQEATNSHYFDRKDDGAHEVWTEIRENPEWSLLEKPNANPHDVTY